MVNEVKTRRVQQNEWYILKKSFGKETKIWAFHHQKQTQFSKDLQKVCLNLILNGVWDLCFAFLFAPVIYILFQDLRILL